MSRFDVSERVLFTHNGVRYRGRVTKVQPKARRVVTDSGKRLLVPVRKLKPSPDRALILETRLDRNLRSGRVYGPMMQQWLSAYGVDTLYEHVHTIEDMRRFLCQEGKNVATRFIHIMGHGTDAGGSSATLHLTFEDLDLVERADVFEKLEGKVLIFSCCELGANLPVLQLVKDVSGAAGVIAYRKEVQDWYTNLAEVLLYQCLINSAASPQNAVKLVVEALELTGTRILGVITRRPVLVCV